MLLVLLRNHGGRAATSTRLEDSYKNIYYTTSEGRGRVVLGVETIGEVMLYYVAIHSTIDFRAPLRSTINYNQRGRLFLRDFFFVSYRTHLKRTPWDSARTRDEGNTVSKILVQVQETISVDHQSQKCRGRLRFFGTRELSHHSFPSSVTCHGFLEVLASFGGRLLLVPGPQVRQTVRGVQGTPRLLVVRLSVVPRRTSRVVARKTAHPILLGDLVDRGGLRVSGFPWFRRVQDRLGVAGAIRVSWVVPHDAVAAERLLVTLRFVAWKTRGLLRVKTRSASSLKRLLREKCY